MQKLETPQIQSMDGGRRRRCSAGFQLLALALLLLPPSSLLFASQISLPRSTNPCPFTAIYNFGDSNSDTGCVFAAFGRLGPPNGKTFFGPDSGRYSDGRLVIDFIAERLGFPYLVAFLDSIRADFAHGANFAASGSTIQKLDTKLCAGGYSPFPLSVQVVQFERFKNRSSESCSNGKTCGAKIPLPEPGSFSGALFTVDIGHNDIQSGLEMTTVEQVKASIPSIIDRFSASLERLYKLGARSFWIHNTGPIGCLPYSVHKPSVDPNDVDPNGCIKSYNEVTQQFNKQLRDKITGLRTRLQEATLVYVDIYSAKYSLISQGNTQGFPHRLEQCCGKSGVGSVWCGRSAVVNGSEVYGDACSNPSEYISWDGIHYTDAACKWVANHIMDGEFSEPKVPIDEACYRHS